MSDTSILSKNGQFKFKKSQQNPNDKFGNDLDEENLTMLENKYIDENDKTVINYSNFLNDINIVFTLSGLEKNPTI